MVRDRGRTRTWRIRLPWRAVALIMVLAFFGIVLPTVVRTDPYNGSLAERLHPPGYRGPDGHLYVLGTDQLGRDEFARLVRGARISLFVGVSVILGSGILGSIAGLMSGFVGGLLDRALMRLVDLTLSIPFLVMAIAVLAALGPSLPLVILLFVIAKWPVYARVVRGETLAAKEREFVVAARASGAGTWRILFRHITPIVISPVFILASFEIASVIISEASLGFLGIGVPPPIPTWGNMLASGRSQISVAWWLVVLPGSAIALTALAANLIGDYLRDFLDPRSTR